MGVYLPYKSNYTNLKSKNQMGDTMLRFPTFITTEKIQAEISVISPIRYKIPAARLNCPK